MMKQLFTYSFILCIFFYCFTYRASHTSKIEAYFNNLKDFSGVVGITKNGKIIFKKAYGHAHRESRTPNDFTTKFSIASNTKSFTAVAITLLHEKGLLNVMNKVNAYVLGVADTITIHHLLTHTSGIPNYYKHWDAMRASTTADDIMSNIASWKLEFEPGTSYAYSNSGYFLLACIIEKVSGMPYAQFLDKHIFKPLGMNNSGSMCAQLPVIDQKASGYIKHDGVISPAPCVQQPLTLLGNGDLYASIDDMLLWIDGLFSGKVLNEESLKMLLRTHLAMECSGDRFCGYGFFLDTKEKKHIAEFSGALVGYLSKVVRIIDDNVSIIILTNVEDMEQFSCTCDNITSLVH